jgi:uncharacterized protein YjbJ (UPF0337 family)
MDQERMKGMAQQGKGSVKETAGKVLGDQKLKAEGEMDKVEGKVRNTVGGIKDEVRESSRKDSPRH